MLHIILRLLSQILCGIVAKFSNTFAINAATIAIPVGVSMLDENTISCKGRTAARSYINLKPLRFRIRYHAVAGWSHAYLHSFQDNGSGNKSGQIPFQRYTNVLRHMRSAIDLK